MDTLHITNQIEVNEILTGSNICEHAEVIIVQETAQGSITEICSPIKWYFDELIITNNQELRKVSTTIRSFVDNKVFIAKNPELDSIEITNDSNVITITIDSNEILEYIDVIESTYDTLIISNNASLQTALWLHSNTSWQEDNYTLIHDNPKLTFCIAKQLCGRLCNSPFISNIVLYNNSVGCNSLDELNDACDCNYSMSWIQQVTNNPKFEVLTERVCDRKELHYQWLYCDDYAPVLFADGQSFAPPDDGYYAPVVSAGCYVDTLDCVSLLSVSTDDAYAPTLSIAPNPCRDVLYIEGEILPSTIVSIYNLDGSLIETLPAESMLDVAHLPPGVYVLSIKKERHRFVKM